MNERTAAPDHAIVEAKQFFDEISRLGFDVNVRTLTDDDDRTPVYSTTVTENGKLVDGGHGKGIGTQSLASAYFETIEHLFDEPYFLLRYEPEWVHEKIAFKCASEIKTQACLYPMVSFRNFLEIPNDRTFPCVKLDSLTSDHSVFVPFMMLTPSYPVSFLNQYTNVNSVHSSSEHKDVLFDGDSSDQYVDTLSIRKYSTSNGAATGLTFEEASIHALSEIVERDAVSLFLIESFANDNPRAFFRVSLKGFSKQAQSVYEYLRRKLKCDILVLDISTELGLVTFAAFAIGIAGSNAKPLAGYGTSIDPEYAIERALTELKQTVELTKDLAGVETEFDLHDLVRDRYPFHEKAFFFDPAIFKKCRLKKTNCISASNRGPTGVEHAFHRIKDTLRNRGFEAFFYSIKTRNQSIFRVKYLVPGMEAIGAHQVVVFPGPRGVSRVKERIV